MHLNFINDIKYNIHTLYMKTLKKGGYVSNAKKTPSWKSLKNSRGGYVSKFKKNRSKWSTVV